MFFYTPLTPEQCNRGLSSALLSVERLVRIEKRSTEGACCLAFSLERAAFLLLPLKGKLCGERLDNLRFLVIGLRLIVEWLSANMGSGKWNAQ